MSKIGMTLADAKSAWDADPRDIDKMESYATRVLAALALGQMTDKEAAAALEPLAKLAKVILDEKLKARGLPSELVDLVRNFVDEGARDNIGKPAEAGSAGPDAPTAEIMAEGRRLFEEAKENGEIPSWVSFEDVKIVGVNRRTGRTSIFDTTEPNDGIGRPLGHA